MPDSCGMKHVSAGLLVDARRLLCMLCSLVIPAEHMYRMHHLTGGVSDGTLRET